LVVFGAVGVALVLQRRGAAMRGGGGGGYTTQNNDLANAEVWRAPDTSAAEALFTPSKEERDTEPVEDFVTPGGVATGGGTATHANPLHQEVQIEPVENASEDGEIGPASDQDEAAGMGAFLEGNKHA